MVITQTGEVEVGVPFGWFVGSKHRQLGRRSRMTFLRCVTAFENVKRSTTDSELERGGFVSSQLTLV